MLEPCRASAILAAQAEAIVHLSTAEGTQWHLPLRTVWCTQLNRLVLGWCELVTVQAVSRKAAVAEAETGLRRCAKGVEMNPTGNGEPVTGVKKRNDKIISAF